jgi:hypothetical protein
MTQEQKAIQEFQRTESGDGAYSVVQVLGGI